MDFELIAGGSALLVIMAIIQVAKSFGMNTKYSPIVAVGLGIAASVAFSVYGDTEVFAAAARGFIVGLSAVGLFSGAKNTVEVFKR